MEIRVKFPIATKFGHDAAQVGVGFPTNIAFDAQLLFCLRNKSLFLFFHRAFNYSAALVLVCQISSVSAHYVFLEMVIRVWASWPVQAGGAAHQGMRVL